MKIPFLITARLKSKRLKKKIIRKIKGKELISHMIDRIKLAKQISKIVICTSNHSQDNQLEIIAKKNKVDLYRGSPNDVLFRLMSAAKKYKAKFIINITADCPLVDPYYIDKVAQIIKKNNYDLVRSFDLPHGIFIYGIKVKALDIICKIKSKEDTEIWERYFTDTKIFNVHDLKISNKSHIWPGLRLTVDYIEDLNLLKKIFQKLSINNSFFDTGDIINLLKKDISLLDINKKCKKNFSKQYNKNNKIKLNMSGLNIKKKYKVYKTFHKFLEHRSKI